MLGQEEMAVPAQEREVGVQDGDTVEPWAHLLRQSGLERPGGDTKSP